MLHLLKDGEFVDTFVEGSKVTIDEIKVTYSPAEAGWSHGEYSLVEAPPHPEPEPPTPEEVRATMRPLTARQFRLGLVGGGVTLTQVDAAIAAIEDAQERTVAQIEWEYATQFNRLHPLVIQLGGAFGLTPEQIDTMWTAALEL